jgi:hypothetical protein
MLEYLKAFNQGLYNVLPFTAQGSVTFSYMMLGMWPLVLPSRPRAKLK